MYLITYSNKASLELEIIYSYIAEDNNNYAVDVIDSISNTMENISIFPYLWTKLWIFRKIVESKYKFVIVYEVNDENNSVTIASIFKNKNNF